MIEPSKEAIEAARAALPGEREQAREAWKLQAAEWLENDVREAQASGWFLNHHQHYLNAAARLRALAGTAASAPAGAATDRETALREKLEAMKARLDENMIADTRVTNGQDLQMHRKRRDWIQSEIQRLAQLLAETATISPKEGK